MVIYLACSLIGVSLSCLTWPALLRWIMSISYVVAFERVVIRDYYNAQVKHLDSLFPPHGSLSSFSKLLVGGCISTFGCYLITGELHWEQWPAAIKIGQLLATVFIPVSVYWVRWCWQQPVSKLLKWFFPGSILLLLSILFYDSLDATNTRLGLLERQKIVLTGFLLVLSWLISVSVISFLQNSEGESPHSGD